jgi:hypothetical protein
MIRLQKRIVRRKKNLFFLFINRFIKAGYKDYIYINFLIVLIKLKRIYNYSFDGLLNFILNYIKPLVELRPKFSSGLIYYLPVPIKEHKAVVLGLSWLVKATYKRFEVTFQEKLFMELDCILELETKEYSRSHVSIYKEEYYNTVLENRVLLYRFKKKF